MHFILHFLKNVLFFKNFCIFAGELMKKLKTLMIVAVCIAAICAGCGDGRTDQVLSRIDTLINDHPDSALQMLYSLKSEKSRWARSQRKQYDMLYLKAENKAFVPLTSDDSIAKDLVGYYDTWGNANERMMAHYLLGCVYRDKGDSPQAIDAYLDAIAQADTMSRDCDYSTLSRVYGQMAGLYHKQLLLSYEIESYRCARHFAFLAKDTLNAIFALDKSTSAYILLNLKDSAELLLNEAIYLYNQYGYTQNAIQSSTKLMYMYVQEADKLPEAKRLIDEYESKSDKFDANHELSNSRRHYYYYKGQYFEGINQLDSAEYYFRKVYYPNMPFTAYNSMHKGLLSVFTKRHQADSIAKYAKLYCEVNDSSITKKDQELTAQMAASYNYSLHQKEARESEAKASRIFIWLIVILFTFLIFILLAFFVYRNIKQKRQAIQDNYARLQQEKMNLEELLTRNQNDYTLEIEEKRATIEALEGKLKESRTYQELNAIDEAIKTDEIVQKFMTIASGKGEAPTLSEWARLRILINSTLPNFVPFIKTHCPSASEPDIELCLLVRLGFRTDQIAQLMHLTPSGVSKSKARLLQKVFHEDTGGAKEFEKRLFAIR